MATIFTHKEVKEFLKEGLIELPISIKLSKPTKRSDGETVDFISVSRTPRTSDMLDIPAGGSKISDYVRPISKITAETEKTIKDLEFKDFKIVLDVLNYFLEDSLTTGESAQE